MRCVLLEARLTEILAAHQPSNVCIAQLCSDVECAAYLFACDPDFENVVDGHGLSVLQKVAENGHVEHVKLLLDCKANMNQQRKNEDMTCILMTPLNKT